MRLPNAAQAHRKLPNAAQAHRKLQNAAQAHRNSRTPCRRRGTTAQRNYRFLREGDQLLQKNNLT
ncbi:Hypothetical predicted protein, partial [Pelobates cultripes]